MDIKVYEIKLIDLKSELRRSDYKAIKHAEGLISDVDYAPIKAQRQAWRDEINEIEEQIKALREEEQ